MREVNVLDRLQQQRRLLNCHLRRAVSGHATGGRGVVPILPCDVMPAEKKYWLQLVSAQWKTVEVLNGRSEGDYAGWATKFLSVLNSLRQELVSKVL